MAAARAPPTLLRTTIRIVRMTVTLVCGYFLSLSSCSSRHVPRRCIEPYWGEPRIILIPASLTVIMQQVAPTLMASIAVSHPHPLSSLARAMALALWVPVTHIPLGPQTNKSPSPTKRLRTSSWISPRNLASRETPCATRYAGLFTSLGHH